MRKSRLRHNVGAHSQVSLHSFKSPLRRACVTVLVDAGILGVHLVVVAAAGNGGEAALLVQIIITAILGSLHLSA